MISRQSLPIFVLASIVAASVAASSGMSAQRPQPGPRVAQDTMALYSEEQAERGVALYGKVCSECHELVDFKTPDFKGKWGGRPVYDLYELIRTTMPDGDPGKLTREEYADATAYIFKLNGLPAGATPLPSDSTALSALKINFPAGAGGGN